jgi:hypothetical protein
MIRMKTNILLIIFMLFLSRVAIAQQAGQERYFQEADSLVRKLYDLVTFEAGQSPDWEIVKSLFIKEAVIVLRTSRDSTTLFSVDSFVDDFKNFIARAKVEETGFTEKIVRLKPMEFGDMAQMLVLYEASIPGSSRGPQQGVDNFLLIRKANRWWIVAITNEIPTPDNPLPPELHN